MFIPISIFFDIGAVHQLKSIGGIDMRHYHQLLCRKSASFNSCIKACMNFNCTE